MFTSDIQPLKETSSVLKNIYGSRLARIILFGSYARNQQTPDSDIDLLVVLKDSQLDVGKEIRFINRSLFDVVLNSNTSISVHPLTQKRFESEASFFLNRIRKEGKEL